MLDAVQEFGERGDAAGALASQQQQFGHVLKRNAASMAVNDFVQPGFVPPGGPSDRRANTQKSQVSLEFSGDHSGPILARMDQKQARNFFGTISWKPQNRHAHL